MKRGALCSFCFLKPCTIVVITDRTGVDGYAVIRLTQKGNPRKMCHSRTKKFDPRRINYPRKKFHPRKITQAKLSPKRTHDPRKSTHDPRTFTHVPRPTAHDPRSFSNPRNPRNPRNLAHSIQACSLKSTKFLVEKLVLSTKVKTGFHCKYVSERFCS